MKIGLLAAAAALFAVGGAEADQFNVTYEAPGVENTTLKLSVGGVETFDAQAVGTGEDFTTDFGTNGAITGTYAGVQINTADQYGGAGGNGEYAVAFSNSPYTLSLSTGVNYFGAWMSALDAHSVVTFYRQGVVLDQITLEQVPAIASLGSAYDGNPNPGDFHGDDASEPFVFVNFVDANGTFDEVQFSESNSCCGFESDNHTVGTLPAPEPATWAMMALGFAGLGFLARRSNNAARRTQSAARAV